MSSASFELRAPTLDDLPALVDFFGAMQAAYGTGGESEGQLRDQLTSKFANAEENYRIAVTGGAVHGWASVWHPEPSSERIFIDVKAHPRELPMYERLLDWAEERAAALAAGRAVRVHAGASSDNELLADEVRKRGYELVRHFFTMEIDLAEEPPAPEWPEGFIGSSEFDPGLVFLAEEGDELAGFSLCKNEVRPNTGHVGVLGVRRPWRRRGLGTALLLHSFREFRRRGRAKADLGVDTENLTGAVRLYERVGMSPVRRFDSYRKELA